MKALRLPIAGSLALMDSHSGLVCCLAVRSRTARTSPHGPGPLVAVDRPALHTTTTGSPRFLDDPSCTSALFSDPGQASPTSHSGEGDAVPASNTARTSAMMMSRLSCTASVPTVYASRGTLPSPCKTRFRLAARLCRRGVEPRGSRSKVSELHLHSPSPGLSWR